MKIRFEPPSITALKYEDVSELIRYLVRLAEKLNIAFAGTPTQSEVDAIKTEVDAIKTEIEVNREYLQRACIAAGITPPDEVSWKNTGGNT